MDVYRPGRLDPNVPIEDTIGAIVRLVKEGYVRAVGLSEVGPDTIRRAQAVHPFEPSNEQRPSGSDVMMIESFR